MWKQDWKVCYYVLLFLKCWMNHVKPINFETGLDQFDKYSLSMIDLLGTKYDYTSVM